MRMQSLFTYQEWAAPNQNPSSGQPQTKPRRYTEWREQSDCLQEIDVFGAGNYVLVITSWTEVGTNLGFPVYRVTSMRFLSCNEGMKNSTAQEHGDEGQLSTAFSAEMQNLSNVRYVSFDFHQVCGNSNFENLKVLYEQISEQFEKQGLFPVDAKGNILEEQKGIVRSNCIGCLDRTNVTQSYLAQKSLDAQLQRTGVLDSSESISVFAEDYQTFKPCMEFFVSCILSFINDQTMSTINI
ncbi:phosphoinositide phosphatase SAC8-like [Malus sylvestris]|uniref:phosphoinositide phosphatase SAC8-like n=1 Tax=Malus sylvestris TaxID=3752 RepID=UPI0021AC66E4|nr:phosphoinositide phosphatase SAC8-like [Malus sylvestris]